MSDSSLVTYVQKSPNYTVGRSHVIDSVAIHCMFDNIPVQKCGQKFSLIATKASSNYGIDTDGNIGLYVSESNTSWCTSNSTVDARCVTIEVACSLSRTPYPISEKAHQALIKLLVDICSRNNISSLRWRADKAYAVAASRGGSVAKQNMFVHRWFSSTNCPGETLYNMHSKIADEVNAKLQASRPSASTTTTTTTTESVNTVTYADDASKKMYSSKNTEIKISYDYEKLHPYFVTFTRQATDRFDLQSFVDAGVSGGVIEAGNLYTSDHKINENYRNPNAYKVADKLISASIPIGWWTYARAQTLGQAKEEIYQLSFIVRKYPPSLGVWLKLELTKSISLNDKLLNEYKDQLIRLGLINKIGIYVDYVGLKSITWSKHKDDWRLWIIDPVVSVSQLDTLLDSTFFDMADKYN